MAVYIHNGNEESVIVDPKGDDDLVIERFSGIPEMTVRKATEEEIKRLWKTEQAPVFGQTKPQTFL